MQEFIVLWVPGKNQLSITPEPLLDGGIDQLAITDVDALMRIISDTMDRKLVAGKVHRYWVIREEDADGNVVPHPFTRRTKLSSTLADVLHVNLTVAIPFKTK